jgi:FKBP-type peptidyl-prolyl cis-trans isomerase FklB
MTLKKVNLKWLPIAAFAFLALSAASRAQDSAANPLKTPKDKVSYAVGAQIALSLKSQGIDIDPDLVAKGFKDLLSGSKLLLSDDELRTTLTALQQQLQQKQAELLTKAAADNKKAGDTFFADNGKKDGVVTLPSGLQYKIIRAGDGKKPSESDTVSCNYRGTLIDGTQFDSSAPGQPATFQVGGVIPGFKEALLLMPAGSKWQVYIPSNLAYGASGAGNAIGPNATLIFDIELLAIQGQAKP